MIGPEPSSDKGGAKRRSFPAQLQLTNGPRRAHSFVSVSAGEEELRKLRSENEHLRQELASQRAATVRTKLDLENAQIRSNRLEQRVFSAWQALGEWFENAAFPMTCVDSDGWIVHANARQIELVGCKRSEYLGQPLHKFLKNGEVVEQILQAAEGGPLPRGIPAKLSLPSGETRPVLITCEPFERNVSKGICCYMQDLTDVLRYRKDRERSEELFRQLTETIQSVFWLSSVDQDEVLYISPQYESIWGQPAEELYRNPYSFLEFVVEEDRPLVEAHLARHRREEGYEIEYRVRRPDGTVCWVKDRGFPVRREDGSVERIAGLAEDITQIKESEQVLRARARQQEALALFGQTALVEFSIRRIFKEAVRVLRKTLNVDAVEVLEFDPEQDDFLLVAGSGWKTGLVGHVRIPDGHDSHAGFTLVQEEPVIMEDLRTEDRFRPSFLLRDHALLSGMTVMIPGRNRPFGVLGVHTEQRRQFSQDDARFLQSMANVLANSIERRTAEKRQQVLSSELLIERRKLDDILQTLPAVVWECEVDVKNGRIVPVFVSDYVEWMLGCRKDAFLENPDFWFEHIHPEDQEVVRRRMLAIVRGQAIGSGTARWVRDDGRIVWIETNHRVVFDSRGRRTGLRGVTVDVSARIRAEIERENALERFSAFMNNAPFVALIKDPEGRYLYANQLITDWFDGLGVEWRGRTDYDLFPSDKARRYRALDRAVLDTNKPSHRIEVGEGRDGERSYWSVFRFPVPDADSGHVVGVLAVDVSDRRRLERKILEISDQEQQRLGQELHDGLCQHLLGLALMGRTLADRMEREAVPQAGKVRELSDFAYEALHLARGLMKGFHKVYAEGPGGLFRALQEFVATTGRLFEKNCQLESEVEFEVIDRDVGAHLFRIAQEAMHNAIKHGNSSFVLLRIRREDDALLLTVENDGNSLPDSPSGHNGMGMHTMRYRADLIGATLFVENRPGGGVVVSCRLPSNHGIRFLD